MKKVLAVLLAVLMTLSVCVVCAAAEDGTTGTTYIVPSAGLGRIKVKASNNAEVQILQGGDAIEFGTTKTAQTIKVLYYPDAAAIKITTTNVKNVDWKDNKIPQYNLNPDNWQLDEGQTAADLMAKSPNYFKSFYTTDTCEQSGTATAHIAGIGDLAHARDSAEVDRGDLENGNPIDFDLPGVKFLGWALFDYSWSNSKSSATVTLYALWDRSAASTPDTPDEPDKPDQPDNPDQPETYDTPIQATLAKWKAKLEKLYNYAVLGVSGLPAGLSMLLNGGFRTWIYGIFGIEA
ncbi:MAG: hypothetical protein IJT44_05495 [Clostridia bacterium]|nr:hypothetical protein [Clostridia bacterium]